MNIRPHLESLPPYTPIEPFEVLSARIGRDPSQIVKLDANENPYGPLSVVREALGKLDFPHIYPDPESRALRRSLATFTGVPDDYLLAGSGADELIDLLMRVFLASNDCILSCPPTFGMYSFDAELNAARCIEIPRNTDFSLDMESIYKATEEYHPKLLFITSPNNPDGSVIPADVIVQLLALPTVVVLDEAYIEFAGENLGAGLSRIREVPTRENLIVLRTFSKWAGLAGLRIGYGAFPKWLMPILWKSKQPYNVNVAANVAAQVSLDHVDELSKVVELLKNERERLFHFLQEIPYLKPYPTKSNFILCKVVGRDAAELKSRLAQEYGIFIRYFNKPGLQDYVRITVGRPQDTDVLVRALKRLWVVCWSSGSSERETRIETTENWSNMRAAEISRQTNETQIQIKLDLDGTGKHEISTGVGFLDHMLTHLAVHGLFDLTVQAKGDLYIDVHHTVEDVALALGQAFDQALGDRKGIVRMGDCFAPMDETLAHVALDLSGRPYAVIQAEWHTPYVGNIPTTLFPHFFESFAVTARCNLHARILYGRDDHHQAEALFKAWARALDRATQVDSRRAGNIPSTKGTMS